MIAYSEALQRILAHAQALPVVPRTPAPGLVLAEAVAAGEDLPPFDNSAMDGFALWVGEGGVSEGIELEVRGSRAAGDAQVDAAGGAWEIMTGAPLPGGMDAVIPVEQVEILSSNADGRPTRIRLAAAVAYGQHVRQAGEDVARGAEILPAGTRLDAPELMLLAALGVVEVPVREAPFAALINTGRELVDEPGRALASGEIRNSNGPYLARRLEQAGAELVLKRTVSDEIDAFLIAMEEARSAGARVVLSTGAVSMGRYDFIPEALARIGAQVHFHKVRIRPGKPLLFATLPNGALFFGLPGNPASSAVGLRFFVEPALRAMLGLPPEKPLSLPLRGGYRARHALRFHLKGRVVPGEGGRLEALVLPGQESFKVAPLAHANAWIVIDGATGSLEEGAPVDVYPPGHLLGLDLQGEHSWISK